ncbi:MAG TPA: secretin N-terminal domain-containing protein [Candidatus Babeliales bacterium]|nr:secretin N-terminal domain-containing protein [Candidatus Babeliales bacterium]
MKNCKKASLYISFLFYALPSVCGSAYTPKADTSNTPPLNTSITSQPISHSIPQQFSNPIIPLTNTTEAPKEEAEPINPTVALEQINKNAAEQLPIYTPNSTSEEKTIEFQFENTGLENLISQMADLFDITFISDDSISPLPQPGGKAIVGNKISFKTHAPLSTSEAWNLFLTFLDIADFALVPTSDPKIFRITTSAKAKKSSIPSFIGVSPSTLPDNDLLIRYVYFAEKKGSLANIEPIIQALRSNASAFVTLSDLNAFVLTDKAYNIKSLMNIVTEIDKGVHPAMSVLKLRQASAKDIKALYDNLAKPEEQPVTARLLAAQKQNSSLYFPENLQLIAEPRTNSLIIFGPKESIAKIQEFIVEHIDVELGAETRSLLRTYNLKYADATTVARIMNEVTKFGKSTDAGKVGGVRDGDKYLKSLSFTPEITTNRIVIRGEEEDYQQAKVIIEKLDEPQPQVNIEILILTLDLQNVKALGTQIRSKTDSMTSYRGGIDGLVGTNVKYQTSGLNVGGGPNSFVVNNAAAGVNRLLGDLIKLVSNPIATAGNTAVTLGSDVFGVWGIFDVLSTITDTQIVSNPFLTISNNQTGIVEVGTERRVVTNQIFSGGTTADGQGADKATLKVEVTPQINSDGMIVLDLKINVDEFTDVANLNSGTKIERELKTFVISADKEVIALGGLVKNNINTSTSKVPVLGNIPLLGWLFKNKTKVQNKSNLLILISTQIIPAHTTHITHNHIDSYYRTLDEMQETPEKRDPINRFFFKEHSPTEKVLDDYIFVRTGCEPGIRSGKCEAFAENKIPKKKRRNKKNKREKRRAYVKESKLNEIGVSQ